MSAKAPADADQPKSTVDRKDAVEPGASYSSVDVSHSSRIRPGADNSGRGDLQKRKLRRRRKD